MEVTLINNNNTPLSSVAVYGEALGKAGSEIKKPEYSHEKADPIAQIAKNKERIEEQLSNMMDHKDLRNFLYMMIGFDIKLETDTKGVGENFNLMA